MAHIALPIDQIIFQDETYASNLTCLNNLADEDSEILIRGPDDLDQVQHTVRAQFQHPIHSEVRRDLRWTTKEDKFLLKYIQLKGKAWSGAARFINRKLHRRLEIRSSKCCKERWRNDLSGRYLEKRWTYEEDTFLLDLYNTFGDSWRCIARRMPGRAEYTIKKRYHKLMIYRWQFASVSSTVASDSYSSTEDDLH
jgi:hypothetical protein